MPNAVPSLRYSLRVGQHVLARDAFNRLKKAVVAPVPRHLRDRSRSEVITTIGVFPKVWVRISGEPVPWPSEDVFVDVETAHRAVARHGLRREPDPAEFGGRDG